MADEKAPLLNYRLTLSRESVNASRVTVEKDGRASQGQGKTPEKLGVIFGVVIPTLLSMFSVVVFLRIGFVVGQAGLYQTIVMFLVAYFIIIMTVLSVCAISTNGALDAGGAYYMISRALGPEFGGSIGLMFFFANVCGSAFYILGLVEAVTSAYAIPEDLEANLAGPYQVLPSGYWWHVLYGTVLLFLCLIVCLVGLSKVGAHIYAKATFVIFIIVTTVLASILISFFIVKPHGVILPIHSGVILPIHSGVNATGQIGANYTRLRLRTLESNLWPDYTVDYTTGAMMSFTTVFAVMFNGCTGIMAGSNMSGDLKNPSYSIPRGTLAAVVITFITYNLMSVLAASSCDRCLLQKDYSFLGDINVWKPLVTIGIYSSTMSAAMSNLIGASRVLYALSKDNLFGGVLALARKTSLSGNPWASVLISWALAQVVLFAEKLNTIAGIVTIFFLLVYAAVDLACLALEWASAPNFRPSFRLFTWHTCVLGILGCLVMMFLISAIYASASIAFMLLLFLLIHYLCPTNNWGYISQALIFHQVRKYLLMLDVRKDHVKFWRPQVLLMVANPRSCTGLITFINDLKKGGLFVLGHVQLGLLDGLPTDPLQSCYDSWLSLVDHLNIKAFVNLTLADSVRHGVQNLLFITGFGGMRPNTLVLGFYDDSAPQDHLEGKSLSPNDANGEQRLSFQNLRRVWENKHLQSEEYVSVIADAIKMGKNVSLGRYFDEFNREEVVGPGHKFWARGRRMGPFVDVWPLNLLRPDNCGYVDTCSLFLLQLASVLHESRAWKQTRLRLFLCVEAGWSLLAEEQEKLRRMLKELRISAQVETVAWDQVVALHWQRRQENEPGSREPDGQVEKEVELMEEEESMNKEQEKEAVEDNIQRFPNNAAQLTDEYISAVNSLIRQHGAPPPAVRFLYLPRPPADTNRYQAYLHQLDLLSRDLGPTLLIHGITPVVTTQL